MKRKLEAALGSWAARRSRKPLVLRGARQVGKSWLVRTWGATRFGSVVELNFEREPALAGAFKGNDPKAALRRLEALTGQLIRPDGTNLLFLDEVQAAPELLAKLRWFAEELPALPVIAAGSLLDFALAEHTFSMPVGRISFLHLEPMGFEEMLEALGEVKLLELLREATPGNEFLVPAVHDKLMTLFRAFVLVGGMPAAVAQYVETGSLGDVRRVHRDLMATFRDDFAKYATRANHARLRSVLDSAPRQLGRIFSYVQVDRLQRSRDLSRAVDLLCLARLCRRVRASPAVAMPLGAGATDARFKLLLADVGLAGTALGVSLESLETDVVLANEGAIAEQVVGQLLRLCAEPGEDPELFFWQRTTAGSQAEVDYVIQHAGKLIPLEVKAGAAGTLKSLHRLMAERRWKRAVRFSSAPPSAGEVQVKVQGTRDAHYELVSLPVYLVEQLPRLLGRG